MFALHPHSNQQVKKLDWPVTQVLTAQTPGDRRDVVFLLSNPTASELKLLRYDPTDMSLTEVASIQRNPGSAVHPLRAAIIGKILIAILASVPNASSGTLVSKDLEGGEYRILGEDVSCFCCLNEEKKILAVKSQMIFEVIDMI